MLRWKRRKIGFSFSADCPDEVKMRMFRTNLMKDNPRVPLCDQRYITPVDEVENGWLIPFFGFIPDKRMEQIKKRVLGMFGKTA